MQFIARKLTVATLFNTVCGIALSACGRVGDVDGLQEVTHLAWQETIAAAQAHNDPGQFTTFIAYEYTSMPGGQLCQRCAAYRYRVQAQRGI